MQLTQTNFSNLNFKSSQYDKYFDDPKTFGIYIGMSTKYDEPPHEKPDSDDFMSDFLREDELFDEKRDWGDPLYSVYDKNDIELALNKKLEELPPKYRYARDYIENNDLKNHFDYLKKYGGTTVIYTVENGYKKQRECIQERLNQGFNKADIVDIYHSGLVSRGEHKIMDFNLVKKGFDLLKDGVDKEIVTTAMDASKLQKSDGSSYYKPELMDFFLKYPKSRDAVVDKEKGYETFNKKKAERYPEFKVLCEDEKDIPKVFKACEIYETKYSKELNDDLCDLASKLLLKESKWTNEHEMIMESVVSSAPNGRKQQVNRRWCDLVARMADGNYSINSIYGAVVLKLKNVELMNNK
jgi:hypothetical protein